MATSYAIECGLRCRRFRQAKNMSQQALADQLHITPQAVSKYETSGISDIDTIKRISEILGQDLLADEMDEEGAVGEVGKEILFQLVMNKGSMPTQEFTEKYLFGMGTDRVNHELMKLAKLGLCVREQYTDVDDKEKDRLFLTAKGVITIKNVTTSLSASLDLSKAIPEVVTYEMLLSEDPEDLKEEGFDQPANSYQEFLDRRPLEKLVMSLLKNPAVRKYRADYTGYLIKEFASPFTDTSFTDDNFLTCVNCQTDILYRMALGIIKDDYDADLYNKEFDEIFDLQDELYEPIDFSDALKAFDNDAQKKNFNKAFPWILDDWEEQEVVADDSDDDSDVEEDVDETPEPSEVKTDKDTAPAATEDTEDDCDDEFIRKEKRLEELEEKQKRYWRIYEDPRSEYYSNMPDDAESPYPFDWYSKEEIEQYIRENIFPAQDDDEREIDRIIAEINKAEPHTLSYYKFTNEWEENGLAELLRGMWNIQNDKQDDEEEVHGGE